MAYCKKFIVLFLILFILFFNFSSVFAVELEDVSVILVGDLNVNTGRNYFMANSGNYVGYFEVERGYIYHISKVGGSYPSPLVSSTTIPSNNVPYNIITTIDTGDTYDYYAINNDFLVLSTTASPSTTTFVITREKIASQGSAVESLVENVGLNSLWDIFGNTTSYILIVVSVALGLFLLVCAIRGISKTKSKF